jgi:beta-galactosidase
MEDCLLSSGIADINPQAAFQSYQMPTSNTARIEIKVDPVAQWAPETPHLYKAVMTLISPDNQEVDFESCRIGFRKIEIVDGVILLNGRRLIVRGVNRHEHQPWGGRSVPTEHMIEEIKQMKRLNINAVRTSHYPDDPIWYDLCDEWGLLLICECNLETHGVNGALSHHPAWGTNFLERAIRMVLTHKNHPSIYSWSLGNESGVGANHAAMAGWIKEYDPTCLCQYESGEPGKNISDVRGNMYATQDKILNMLSDGTDIRPVVLVEYLYQIRNAGGGMHKFLELLENHKRFQGGYIWDWQDKCLVCKTAKGKEYFAYGGDFGESLTDWMNPTYMTNNGIVLPDLTPKPAALEAKQVYCPIIFDKTQSSPWQTKNTFGHFIIKNRSLVLDSSNYKVSYAIRENGFIIKTGLFKLPYLKAGEEIHSSFDEEIDKKPNSEYHVEFSVQYAKDTAYAQAGDELGCFQFRLDSGETAFDSSNFAKSLKQSSNKDIYVDELDDSIKISGADFSVTIDKTTGLIASCMKSNAEYLAQGPTECFTRPYSGIDAQQGWGRYAIWNVFDSRNTNSTLKQCTFEATGAGKTLVETIREVELNQSPLSIIVTNTYMIYSNGKIKVNTQFYIDPSLKDLPRVGVEMIIPETFEYVEYWGLGPRENYRDRKEAARLGVFKSRIEDQHFPFIPPSENGGHEETRWISLTDDYGRQILITSPIPFHFDIHHNSIEDYKNAKHEHELIRRKESFLHIDAAHSGIGSDMGWSTMLTDDNKVKAQNYTMEFTIDFV